MRQRVKDFFFFGLFCYLSIFVYSIFFVYGMQIENSFLSVWHKEHLTELKHALGKEEAPVYS